MRSHPIRLLIKFLIILYQSFSLAIHRIMGIPDGGGCRFTPTCSEYTLRAVDEHGVIKGLQMGMTRLSKCHPWGKT